MLAYKLIGKSKILSIYGYLIANKCIANNNRQHLQYYVKRQYLSIKRCHKVQKLDRQKRGMMDSGLYKNNFSEAFNKLLHKTGVSCYRISQYSHMDQAYLSRLKNGEKGNPSPEVIMKICLAIADSSAKTNVLDFEKLMNSAGRSLNINH